MAKRWRGVLVVAALLLGGCGQSNQAVTTATGTPVGSAVASAAAGFVTAPSARNTALTVGPAAGGGVAQAGGTVEVLGRDGQTVAQTTTGADGGFSLTNVPFAGTTSLRITPTGSTTPTIVWVTLVNGRQVTLGTVYPVTRATALATLQGLAPAGALVALTQNPLPANTEVHPTYGDVNGQLVADSTVHLTAADEWLGLIDANSDAPFSHEVEYVYIDAQTGTATHDDHQPWLPSVNFVPVWDYSQDLIRVTGTLPKASAFLTPGSPVAAGAVVASPDLVQAPTLQQRLAVAPPATTRQVSGNPNWFGLIWIGVPEVWFLVDASRVYTWMVAQGIPSDHIYQKDGSLYHDDSPPPLMAGRGLSSLLPGGEVRGREVSSGFTAVEAAVKKVRASGGDPTLFVWAESHGAPTGQVRVLDVGGAIGTAAYNMALKIGSWFSSNVAKVTPPPVTAIPLEYIDDVLPLHTTVACDVRAWAATCYSYNHLQRWRANFLPTKHDVKLYSSSGNTVSFGNGFLSQFGNYFSGDETHFSELGLNFTRQVTSFQAPAFTPYASPPASTGPQTWVRPSNVCP